MLLFTRNERAKKLAMQKGVKLNKNHTNRKKIVFFSCIIFAIVRFFALQSTEIILKTEINSLYDFLFEHKRAVQFVEFL